MLASHEKQGLHGGVNSCILTLNYPAENRQHRSVTLFIKAAANPETAEAQKYQFLSTHGIPTPRLLATVHRDGVEIIVLEFLPTIGIDFHSNREVGDLLDLAAQLNAIQEPMDFIKPVAQDSQSESAATFDAGVMAALVELSHDSTVSVNIDVRRWFEAYQLAQQAYHTMPLAITHGQFFFQQVGWAPRDAGSQLVLFDLETMSLRPRFTDIQSVLQALSRFTRRSQTELFEIYYERLCQLNSCESNIDEAFRELRLVRITESCYSLQWLVAEMKQPDFVGFSDILAMTLDCLSDDLATLGFA